MQQQDNAMEDAVNIKNMARRAGVVLIVAVMIAIAICIGCSSKESVPPTVSTTDSTVTINGTTWTRQNLNIETPDSWCYEDAPDSCAKYGRLYTYGAAEKACQRMGGTWRLPTDGDWSSLMKAAGGVRKKRRVVGYKNVGKTLKSKSGWSENGNGTDDYGFSALPGGFRFPFEVKGSFFGIVGTSGHWWIAGGRGLFMSHNTDYAFEIPSAAEFPDADAIPAGDKSFDFGYSVRCVGGE